MKQRPASRVTPVANRSRVERDAPTVPFTLDKSSKIPFYEQIKYQCDAALHVGSLKARSRMPTVREMARILDVNAKTVLKIYHRLQEDGLIEIRVGSGVQVTGASRDYLQNYLCSVVSMAERHMAEAKRLQISPLRYLDLLHEFIEGKQRRRSTCLVVECNTEQIRLFSREIETHLEVKCHPVLLEDLERMTRQVEALLHEASFLITTDFHWGAVARIAHQHQKTPLRIRLSPKFVSSLIECAQRGGIVMIVSSLDFFPNFQRSFRQLGHQHALAHVFAALPSDRRRLAKIFKEVKHAYISPLCARESLLPLPPWVALMPSQTHVCSDSLDTLRGSMLVHFLQRAQEGNKPLRPASTTSRRAGKCH